MFSAIKFCSTNIYLIAWVVFSIWLFYETRGKKNWRIKRIAIIVFFWIVSIRPVGELLLYPFEHAYTQSSIETIKESGVKDVVVLTGGHSKNKNGGLLTGYLGLATMRRFVSGMELCANIGDDARLIITGRDQKIESGRLPIKELAKEFLPNVEIYAETESRNTSEHPVKIKQFLESDSLIMVTSASHIPRSMRAFKKHGLEPIPYPVDFMYNEPYEFKDFLPNAGNLTKIQRAVYEYWATALYWFK